MYNMKGQVALVTGASGAIGSHSAKLLHALGAYVVISGTNTEKLEILGQELSDNYQIEVCDLSNLESCNNIIEKLAKLDILVCNAGVTDDSLGIRMSDKSFAKVININLSANFALNRASIKKMMKQRYGRIINISSVVAVTGNPGQANYCASKAGLIGMTKSLAYEAASRNITVNAIAPGFINSNMTNKLSESQITAILSKIPMQKMGIPEDVANVVGFLAAKESSYITGQTIHVNGGMAMI